MKNINFTIPQHLYERLTPLAKQLITSPKVTVGYLLSTSSKKAVLAEDYGYLDAILYLRPASGAVEGINLCSGATKTCIRACIGNGGRIGMDQGLKAQIVRTLFLLSDPGAFLARLELEIASLQKSAAKKGYKLAVRLNGSSDVPFEASKHHSMLQKLSAAFPDVVFYDYTKIVGRCFAGYRANQGIPNYHLTFSWSGQNAEAIKRLDAGINVAVPFAVKKGEDLPKEFLGREVIDGDIHDLRFLDKKGVIVGLRYKMARKVESKGAYRASELPEFIVQL